MVLLKWRSGSLVFAVHWLVWCVWFVNIYVKVFFSVNKLTSRGLGSVALAKQRCITESFFCSQGATNFLSSEGLPVNKKCYINGSAVFQTCTLRLWLDASTQAILKAGNLARQSQRRGNLFCQSLKPTPLLWLQEYTMPAKNQSYLFWYNFAGMFYYALNKATTPTEIW